MCWHVLLVIGGAFGGAASPVGLSFGFLYYAAALSTTHTSFTAQISQLASHLPLLGQHMCWMLCLQKVTLPVGLSHGFLCVAAAHCTINTSCVNNAEHMCPAMI